ncbi:hypothetical protein E4T52_01189 [Aureobasidium sp. EXF-3400]|nr:hypothetical protein E4T51_00572 [Aureobasidium sp. EXF-12344]KAI4783893.1 hypothetical protein E4T52_01189 [Aureobasidium sp. EXF-3400]
MSHTPQKLALNSGLLEQLQARFPSDIPPSPSSPIAKGIAALERRTSNRSATSQYNKPGSRTASPLHMNLATETPPGIRSTASSPGPLPGNRRVPPPPLKTKIRPASELFLPTPRTAKSAGFRFSTIIPEDGLAIKSEPATPETPISVPSFSTPALSPVSASIADAISRVDVGASVQNAIDNLSKPEANRFIFPPLRSSTAPPTSLRRQPSFASMKSSKSLPLQTLSTRLARMSRAGGGSSRGAGVNPNLSPKKRGSHFSGIDKDLTADRRVSFMLAKHKSNLESVLASPIEEQAPVKPVLRKAATSVMPWRKRARGETMSMLLDSGFFPVQEFIYEKNDTPPSSATRSPSKRNQLALNILVKDLPTDRPSSIVNTPTNFYQQGHTSLRRSTRSTQRRSLGPRRRVLTAASVSSSQASPITVTQKTVTTPLHSPTSPTTPLTPTKALAALTAGMLLPPSPGADDSPKSGQPSPGILEVIPEDNGGTTAHSIMSPISHNSVRSIPEAPALPDATGSEIHLSSGTVLMVKTPESTAWRRSVYIQGPIKLPTPAVVPRKGSIATLDPFQDVLSNTPIPRRKSEDTCLDDICDWYDTWNYCPVSFAGDEFTLDAAHLVNEYAMLPLTEEPENAIDHTMRSPSPAPPLAKQVAAAMLRPDTTAIKPRPRMSMPMVPLPDLPKPSSNTSSENLLHQKGHSRNSSGETSYKSASSDPIHRTDSRGSGMSEISSVEEKSWFENDVKAKAKRGSLQEMGEQQLKQKPARMSRMRRFVQTASAIL